MLLEASIDLIPLHSRGPFMISYGRVAEWLVALCLVTHISHHFGPALGELAFCVAFACEIQS